jgi:hypothetical protein
MITARDVAGCLRAAILPIALVCASVASLDQLVGGQLPYEDGLVNLVVAEDLGDGPRRAAPARVPGTRAAPWSYMRAWFSSPAPTA